MTIKQIDNLKIGILEFQKALNFQVRESAAPLNIPTPTPAPDRGVAWVGGPVAVPSIFQAVPWLYTFVGLIW